MRTSPSTQDEILRLTALLDAVQAPGANANVMDRILAIEEILRGVLARLGEVEGRRGAR